MYNIAIEFKRGEPLQATINDKNAKIIRETLICANSSWIALLDELTLHKWIIRADEIITINMIKGEETE